MHCAAGYRSAVAASLLQAAGRQVTAIDDEFGHAAEAGLPVVPSRLPPGTARRAAAAGQSPGGLLRTSTVPL